MKNVRYKFVTAVIILIVIIQLIVAPEIIGFGFPDSGWHTIYSGLMGQDISYDFTSRNIGIVLMLVLLLIVGFLYIAYRIYKAVSKKKTDSQQSTLDRDSNEKAQE